jgi:hypothetical protein
VAPVGEHFADADDSARPQTDFQPVSVTCLTQLLTTKSHVISHGL